MTRKKSKIFVLDTSVLLHDHQAITNFENHDVAIPITVLEELDKFKIGNDTTILRKVDANERSSILSTANISARRINYVRQ